MNHSSEHNPLCFIFVHGFQGWGSYDERYQKMPYWGMRGGDLISFLQSKGYSAFAASVDPLGSAWDRACELYAQLAGTKTDYGLAHSREYGHPRFGKDFTGRELIPSFDRNTRLVLIGHSFGGITANLFAELMANGDLREKEETDPSEISPLFQGGMGERIRCVTGIAAGFNGNSSYEIPDDYPIEGSGVKIPWWSRLLASRMKNRAKADPKEKRDFRDCAEYDMQIDHACAINERIGVLPHVLYLSVPCCFTVRNDEGYYVPEKKMEPMFILKSVQMGSYAGTTENRIEVDAKWRRNDGRVNTISEIAPFNAFRIPLNRKHLRTGIWNIFPVYHGSHMSLQGGFLFRHDIRPFYEDLLAMITAFEDTRV